MSKRLLAPCIISFDAFGTLYTPREPISLLYHRLARQFGINKPVQELDKEFPTVFSGMMKEFPNYGKLSNNSNIQSCDDWWLELIVRLFKLESFQTNAQSEKFCNMLLNYFTSKVAYEVYPDVVPTLEYIKKKNIPMIISSNSDSRLRDVLQDLSLSQYFEGEYLSYELGVSKPSRDFFEKIRSLEKVEGQIWHIGDELSKDYVGLSEAGINWEGILIERDYQKRSDLLEKSGVEAIAYLTDLMQFVDSVPRQGVKFDR